MPSARLSPAGGGSRVAGPRRARVAAEGNVELGEEPLNRAILITMAVAAAGCRPARADPKAPFPDQVAGFRFGVSPTEFAAQCRLSGKASALERDHDGLHFRTCDAVEVEPGWRWSLFGGFCDRDARLCELQYFSTNSFAPRDFKILRERFAQRFGPAVEAKGSLADGALDCAQGDGRVGRAWYWGAPSSPTHRVLLTYECKNGAPMLGVFFNDPSSLASHGAARGHAP
jgi:hypothetical protein